MFALFDYVLFQKNENEFSKGVIIEFLHGGDKVRIVEPYTYNDETAVAPISLHLRSSIYQCFSCEEGLSIQEKHFRRFCVLKFQKKEKKK